MERFFFHLRAGGLRKADAEGFLYVDLGSATRDALGILRGIVDDRIKTGQPVVDLAIDISDAAGATLETVSTLRDVLVH
jgi:hypothetical protein